jgi:hypothetical protein
LKEFWRTVTDIYIASGPGPGRATVDSDGVTVTDDGPMATAMATDLDTAIPA